jgi:hypothetical protein
MIESNDRPGRKVNAICIQISRNILKLHLFSHTLPKYKMYCQKRPNLHPSNRPPTKCHSAAVDTRQHRAASLKDCDVETLASEQVKRDAASPP